MASGITPARVPLAPTSDVSYKSQNIPRDEAQTSGVSWAAVAGGAFATAALSLILLALGAGAGLSSLSPWSTEGLSTTSVKVGALIWLCVVELIASALGGYLAGRLRTKWVNVHTDEVYFRDTAHGFLTWCVALVVTVAFLGSAAATMVGSAESRNANSTRGTESAIADPNRYYIDSLFRSSEAPPAGIENTRAEASIIFAHALRERALLAEDKTYLAERVAGATGLSRSQADRRVDEVFERDQVAADAARKAVAHMLYWLFVALLLGAFSASFAATFGGRQRDLAHVHA